MWHLRGKERDRRGCSLVAGRWSLVGIQPLHLLNFDQVRIRRFILFHGKRHPAGRVLVSEMRRT